MGAGQARLAAISRAGIKLAGRSEPEKGCGAAGMQGVEFIQALLMNKLMGGDWKEAVAKSGSAFVKMEARTLLADRLTKEDGRVISKLEKDATAEEPRKAIREAVYWYCKAVLGYGELADVARDYYSHGMDTSAVLTQTAKSGDWNRLAEAVRLALVDRVF